MKWKQRHIFAAIIAAGALFVFYEATQQQDALTRTEPPLLIGLRCIRDGTCGGNKNIASEAVIFEKSEGEQVTEDRWISPGWPPAIKGECPDRYLTVNTHTWGRHHNQLQSVMNGLVTAHLLNRTFVLGHFRHAKNWFSVSDYYDFSELAFHYCIIDHSSMIAKMKDRPKPSVSCHGQNINDLPLGKSLGLKCSGKSESFSNFNFKAIIDQKLIILKKDTSTILNLSGQLAFYLRPGLNHISQSFALLKAAPAVKAEVDLFQQMTFGNSDYVAIHLRYREGTCIQEIDTDFVKAFNISAELHRSLQVQCKINYAYSKRVLEERFV